MRKVFLFSILILFILISSVIWTPAKIDNNSFCSIASLSVNSGEYVLLGGNVIGINIKTNGLTITSKINVVTANGIISPFGNVDVKLGDILYSIDDTIVDSIDKIDELIEDKTVVVVRIKRNIQYLEYEIKPVVDMITKRNKIGLLIQEDIAGIGTITYINPKDNSYAALGHPIKDYSGEVINNGSGQIYKANVVSVVKGKSGAAGELNGLYSNSDECFGSILKSNEYGIFGKINASENDIQKIQIGNRNNVKVGPAKIYSTIEGNKPKYYDIEISKIYTQYSESEKSMIIKIKDPELLEKTGGIVQGMSGSPIVQNNKLVGAVTHVMISDSTCGYGVYIDWMNKY